MKNNKETSEEISEEISEISCNVLFLPNLPKDTTEREVFLFFRKCEGLEKIDVKQRYNNVVAFVTFSSIENAKIALEENNGDIFCNRTGWSAEIKFSSGFLNLVQKRNRSIETVNQIDENVFPSPSQTLRKRFKHNYGKPFQNSVSINNNNNNNIPLMEMIPVQPYPMQIPQAPMIQHQYPQPYITPPTPSYMYQPTLNTQYLPNYFVRGKYLPTRKYHHYRRKKREKTPKSTLFVFGLPKTYDKNKFLNMIKEKCTGFADLKDSKNINDGCCFLKFENVIQAKESLKFLNGLYYDGCYLGAEYARQEMRNRYTQEKIEE